MKAASASAGYAHWSASVIFMLASVYHISASASPILALVTGIGTASAVSKPV